MPENTTPAAAIVDALNPVADLLARGGQSAGPADWRRAGTPRYPGVGLIRAAKVRPPPLIEPDWCDLERFEFVAKTWKTAVRSLYAGSSDAEIFIQLFELMRRKKFEKLRNSRYFQLLDRAALKFCELGIEPAVWIAFSFEVWRQYGDGDDRRPPPPRWVFLTERIEERHGWFESVAPRYRGGQVFFSRYHRELYARHSAMRRRLSRLPESAPDSAVQAIVEACFPNNRFALLVDRANEEADRMQAKLDELAARGEWLWTPFEWPEGQ